MARANMASGLNTTLDRTDRGYAARGGERATGVDANICRASRGSDENSPYCEASFGQLCTTPKANAP